MKHKHTLLITITATPAVAETIRNELAAAAEDYRDSERPDATIEVGDIVKVSPTLPHHPINKPKFKQQGGYIMCDGHIVGRITRGGRVHLNALGLRLKFGPLFFPE